VDLPEDGSNLCPRSLVEDLEWPGELDAQDGTARAVREPNFDVLRAAGASLEEHAPFSADDTSDDGGAPSSKKGSSILRMPPRSPLREELRPRAEKVLMARGAQEREKQEEDKREKTRT